MAGVLGHRPGTACADTEAQVTTVVWTEAALSDILLIRTYLAQSNPKAATDIAIALKGLGDTLMLFPHRGRPVPGHSVRELVAVYPYVIRYRVAGDEVVILRVRHAARRPTD